MHLHLAAILDVSRQVIRMVAQDARVSYTTTLRKALSWQFQQNDTYGVVVTDSQSMLRRIEMGLLCRE